MFFLPVLVGRSSPPTETLCGLGPDGLACVSSVKDTCSQMWGHSTPRDGPTCAEMRRARAGFLPAESEHIVLCRMPAWFACKSPSHDSATPNCRIPLLVRLKRVVTLQSFGVAYALSSF